MSLKLLFLDVITLELLFPTLSKSPQGFLSLSLFLFVHRLADGCRMLWLLLCLLPLVGSSRIIAQEVSQKARNSHGELKLLMLWFCLSYVCALYSQVEYVCSLKFRNSTLSKISTESCMVNICNKYM